MKKLRLHMRNLLLPILYSYMRVLMMSSGDKDDVIDFLTNKKTECKSEIAEFIDNAISMLRE